jgi:hypothetical protein
MWSKTTSYPSFNLGKEKKKMKRTLVILALCLTLVLPVAAQAAVFDMARDYIPAPPGTFATFWYYQHISADKLYVNNHINFNDIGLSENIGLLRPVYWLDTGPLINDWGMIIDPQFIIPFGNVSINASSAGTAPNASNLAPLINTSATGIGDALWFATFWFVHNNDTKTWIGFTPIFITPTGMYRASKLLNLGANRWAFEEQLGIVQGLTVIPGHNMYFEFIPHGEFYTSNTRFSNRNAQASVSARNIGALNALAAAGGPTGNAGFGSLRQDPEVALEAHISYDLTKSMWASADYFGRWLSNQKWQGISLNNSENTQTVGLTMAYAFSPGYQLAFQYQTDVTTKSGTQNQVFLARFIWATDLKGLFGSGSEK